MPKNNRAFAWGKIVECEKFGFGNARLVRALEFLKRPDLADLPIGRHEIEKGVSWAMVQECELAPFGEVQRSEVHRDFIDIQTPLDGPETYGLVETGGELYQPFDADRDVGFAEGKTAALTLNPGEFAIFFPIAGAHAPGKTMGAPVKRRKIVIKIRN